MKISLAEFVRSPQNPDLGEDELPNLSRSQGFEGLAFSPDRSAVPEGQIDGDPDDIGDWESSGILDVSDLFGEDPGSLFLFDVQAHSLTEGNIGEDESLVQGGQLAFLINEETTTEESSFEPIFGSLEGDTIEVNGSNQLAFAGEGDDLIDLSLGEGGNRAFGDGGNDTFILGQRDRISGAEGDVSMMIM